ncbi:MAG: flagellar hook-associated protein FlgK, partial [Desulfuromonadales bacterium C00003093]
MSGLGLILSIARDALAAQQYGINVTGHNIANVNTEGYSRQTSVNEAREPAPYGGLLLGRGVDVTQVLRASDQFIESQLMDRKSDMSTSQELENYMQVVEGLFNENSEASISMMMSKFWNLCQDIANNPSGSTERVALYEHSILMSDQFKTLNTDLMQIQTDLTRALSAGIVQINEITNEMAQVNGQLVGMEAATSIANDLRDKRNTLTSELAQYIDVKTFEQTNGSLTIITAKGCVLVHGNDNYNLV